MSEKDKTWTPEEVAAQLRKPDGTGGIIVAENMQEANKGLYDMVLAEIPKSGPNKLLEIGFGNGEHFYRFLEGNPATIITGLDFSETMCKKASDLNPGLIENNQLNLIFSDAATMPFEDNYFDTIIGINTIYFWTPIEKYLAEIYRVLKPGGKLLIGYRPKETMDMLPFTNYGFRKFQIQEFADLLIENKFQLIDQKQISGERIPVFGEKYWNTDVVAIATKL